MTKGIMKEEGNMIIFRKKKNNWTVIGKDEDY